MSTVVKTIMNACFATLLGGLSACGASTGTSGSTEFRVFPTALYAGFGGTDLAYKTPILSLNCPGTVAWTVSDPTIAAIDSREQNNATFKMLKSGSTTVVATCGTKTASATLQVAAYTSTQVTAGKTYWDGHCTQCHSDTAGYDDTPTQLDADTDEEVAHTFQTGLDPEGRALAVPGGVSHKFTPTDPAGLVAFMRSRAPNGYPEPDHGL